MLSRAKNLKRTKIRQWENGKFVDFNDLTQVWRRPSKKSLRISTNHLYCQKLESLSYIFAVDRVGLLIFIYVFVACSKKRIFSVIECVSAVQGHPRSTIFVPIENEYNGRVLCVRTQHEIKVNIFFHTEIDRYGRLHSASYFRMFHF